MRAEPFLQRFFLFACVCLCLCVSSECVRLLADGLYLPSLFCVWIYKAYKTKSTMTFNIQNNERTYEFEEEYKSICDGFFHCYFRSPILFLPPIFVYTTRYMHDVVRISSKSYRGKGEAASQKLSSCHARISTRFSRTLCAQCNSCNYCQNEKSRVRKFAFNPNGAPIRSNTKSMEHLHT